MCSDRVCLEIAVLKILCKTDIFVNFLEKNGEEEQPHFVRLIGVLNEKGIIALRTFPLNELIITNSLN